MNIHEMTLLLRNYTWLMIMASWAIMVVIKLHLYYRLERECNLKKEKNLELHDKVITWLFNYCYFMWL